MSEPKPDSNPVFALSKPDDTEAERWKKSAMFYLDESIRKGQDYRKLFMRFCTEQTELAVTRRMLRDANAKLAKEQKP